MMDYPLSLIADMFADEHIEVLQSPRNQSLVFEWVTADPGKQLSDPGKTVVVTSTPSDLSPDTLGILISNAAQPALENSFVISAHGLSPSQLTETILYRMSEIANWVIDMHFALARHCGCAELLEISEPILRNYISVTDSTFRYIAHTTSFGPLEEASRYLLEHGRYSEKTLDEVRKSGLSELWNRSTFIRTFESNTINPMPSIEHIYHLNGQYAAHMVMVCPKPITKGQEFLFGLLVGPIGSVLANRWEVENPLKQRYTSFLTNLIHEDASNREVTAKQAELLGIPVEGLFKLYVVDNAWKGGSAHYVAMRTMTHMPECKVIVEGSLLIILVLVEGKATRNRLKNLENRVIALADDLQTQVGISRKFTDLHNANRAFQEAKIALKYGKLCFKDYIKPGEHIEDNPTAYAYRFKRYFPYYVGDPTADKDLFLRRHNVATQILGRIENDDLANGTSDIKILQSYLRAGGRIRDVCEALDMHRNSVLYRLRHLEKAYDIDLSDPDERIFLSTLFLLPR